jgi:hypothetical protein
MSVTQTDYLNLDQTMKVVTLEWTAETSGSFTSATITGCKGMYLTQVVTVPGNRAPTGNYDPAITDPDGLNVIPAATLQNRSASAAEVVFPPQVSRPIDSDLTLAITGNSVDRANGKIKLYLSKFPVAIVAAT